MKYRKKPVVIEAVQLLRTPEQFTKVYTFLKWYTHERGKMGKEKWDEFVDVKLKEEGVIIPTLEGDHLARWGDFIIKGVNGEFYPCKPDIFEKTYDKV